ncbi:MAG: type I-B CRISPR-associated endonuclease Cas1 [Thermoguttaceae bacterium]|nr:type I-B CRISPR-associated endonuclease Cas1 [Thermoguttaceae bacterium]
MKKSYYLYNNGTLRRRDNTIQFETETGERRDLPVERVSDLYLFSETTLNTRFLNFMGGKGIAIHCYNYYDFYTGSFVPRTGLPAGALLVRQVEHYTDARKRTELARAFVLTAAANIYRNLRYYNSRGKDLSAPMKTIEGYERDAARAQTVQELMGFEGLIHQTYYESWNTIVDQNIDFTKRVRRPPDNMINTLISFVNSLIYTKTLTEIYHTQLNPTISYLHEPGVRRYSLCLDVSEVFKPLLADRLIFALLNRNQITEESFTEELNGLHLKKSASQKIVQELDERLKKTINHRDLDRQVSYQRLIRLECYKLIKHFLGEKKYDGFKIWW